LKWRVKGDNRDGDKFRLEDDIDDELVTTRKEKKKPL
jgi:hypothetical protein